MYRLIVLFCGFWVLFWGQMIFTLARWGFLMSLNLRSLIILNLALIFILFSLDHAFIKLLNFDRFLSLLPIFPFRLDKSFNAIILRRSSETQVIRCIGLYHLLYIVIIILLWLCSKRPKLLFLRDWKSLIVVKTIEVIEHTLYWLSKAHRNWCSFSHWARRRRCDYWKLRAARSIGLLNWRLVHCCF